MPYPGQFHKLVLIGNLYTDVFNTTLSIVPSALGELGMPEVDAPTLAAVAADVGAWFPKLTGAGGVSIINNAQLTSIKLNRIDAAGHYVDSPTMEHTYPSPIAGGFIGSLPPQLSMAATLATAVPRGRGSKGRMYLPPNTTVSSVVVADGRVSAANALAVATGVKALIDALNATYTLVGRVGVASNAGAGRFEHVTEVRVGRVIDTIRSRRNKLEEDYQSVAI